MTIQVGEKIPDVKLLAVDSAGRREVSTAELFAGKKVVLFGLTGAFTSTCSAKHLPGFVAQAGAIRAKGVDLIACLAVNDAAVMDAWAKAQGVEDRVLMLADGNAAFTKALGLDVDISVAHMGVRTQRFASVVDDGVVTALQIEQPLKFEVSSAEAVLALLAG